METRTYNTYKFDELPKEVQAKVLDNYYSINTDHEWYDSTYEDAKSIGLKITGFDLDRSNYCNGELTDAGLCVANKIIENHGETCDTYKLAITYKEDYDTLAKAYPLDDDECETPEYEEAMEQLDTEFLKDLLIEYKIMLRNEYEYLTSKEAIIETLRLNDYDFTLEGKID